MDSFLNLPSGAQVKNRRCRRKNKWWDGYEGEDVVIIEEWSPDDKLSLQNLKEWADKWPFGAERKGGYMIIRPRRSS